MHLKTVIDEMTERVCSGERLTADEALQLAGAQGADLLQLFAGASRIREQQFGSEVSLCSIINAKSGRCPENCSFCAQSAHHSTETPVYPLVNADTIAEQARQAEQLGSECFGIITSGTGISAGTELEELCTAVRRIAAEGNVDPSCSLGIIDFETALALKEAGMVTYHHNLETAASFFPSICTTHRYEEDVETVKNAKRAGLKVCCGGIFGMGESVAQRIELALLLRELEVDSVPINFLDPVPGTALQDADFLTPIDCLKTIALYRFLLPDRKIAVCGGRERNLRELQSWIFAAGASGMMTGDYLTKKGRNPDADRQLLVDLQLTVAPCRH